MLVRIGDEVDAEQPLIRVFANSPAAATIRPMIASAMTIGGERVVPPELIVERIGSDSAR